jgi:prepilin-type N-terminal cleavage/methylation domain-containing protein
MSAKRLRGESGYSLVEVMVAIMIMAVALLPMVAMFDMGLHSTTVGSNYDRARMLANMKLEEAKNLPYNTVRDSFPEPVGTTTPYNGSGCADGTADGCGDPPYPWKTEPGADFANLQYRVEKQHMMLPNPDDASSEFEFNPTDTGLLRVKVTVQWSDANNNLRSYETFGLVAR